jgi:MFS family permease
MIALRRPPWLTRNVAAIGAVSLLTDVSSEMIVPLLPLFLAVELGAGPAALGMIEGIADGVSSLLKLWSGRRADKTGRYRPFVVGGYALSSFARPFIALAAAPVHVAAVRAIDRVGKGLRTSARDAILTASVDPAHRGVAFGFHRAMDHAGATIGPLVAVGLLSFFTDDLRVVFAAAAVPGVLATVAVLAVHEAPPPPPADPSEAAPPDLALWRVLVPVTLFAVAAASDTFLLLRAGHAWANAIAMPLLWVGLNLVRALAAIPGGWLTDHLGARATLGLGWLVHAAVFAALGLATDPAHVLPLVMAYGLHAGLAEPAQKALVARRAAGWGAAFGWYNACLGLAGISASVGFGLVWEAFGSPVAFLGSAAVGAAATAALLFTVPADRPA